MQTSARASKRMLRRGWYRADHRSRRSFPALAAVACRPVFAAAWLPSPAGAQDRFFDVDPLTAPIDGGTAS